MAKPQDQSAEFRSPVEERHIDFLLEEEFCCSQSFLNGFLELARAKLNSSSAISPQAFECNDEHKCRAVRSVTTGAGETDVLVKYISKDTAIQAFA